MCWKWERSWRHAFKNMQRKLNSKKCYRNTTNFHDLEVLFHIFSFFIAFVFLPIWFLNFQFHHLVCASACLLHQFSQIFANLFVLSIGDTGIYTNLHFNTINYIQTYLHSYVYHAKARVLFISKQLNNTQSIYPLILPMFHLSPWVSLRHWDFSKHTQRHNLLLQSPRL